MRQENSLGILVYPRPPAEYVFLGYYGRDILKRLYRAKIKVYADMVWDGHGAFTMPIYTIYVEPLVSEVVTIWLNQFNAGTTDLDKLEFIIATCGTT